MPIQPSRVQELLEEAEAFLDEYPPNVAMARKTLEVAVNMEPENPQVLDACGAFFIEYEDERVGVAILKKSIQVSPETNPLNYFYLGQLSIGREAVNYFSAGLQLAKKMHTTEGVVSALCSLGELWMTEELCDEPEARQSSESAFRAALKEGPNQIEPLVGLAGFCKIVREHKESEELCIKAVKILAETEDVGDIPFPLRLNLCRTLIDLELAEEALSVLHYLLQEDEEDVEAWFLVACAHLMSDDCEAAAETVSHAFELCKADVEQKKLWGDNLRNLREAIKERRQVSK
jgi:tetratricopeptide (TPR) repeat protein